MIKKKIHKYEENQGERPCQAKFGGFLLIKNLRW